MTNDNASAPLTDLEKTVLKEQQTLWGSALDFNQVEQHMQTLHENDTTLSISQLNNDNPNISTSQSILG